MRRSHVEMRSRDFIAPRQAVSDDHSKKRLKPRREANKMSAPLAKLLTQLAMKKISDEQPPYYS